MNGFHSGLLRVYVRLGHGPRVVRWQMYGDQLPGWRSADIELNITSVTEVHSVYCCQPTSSFYRATHKQSTYHHSAIRHVETQGPKAVCVDEYF